MSRYRPSWLRLPTEYADTHVEVSLCAAAGMMHQCPFFTRYTQCIAKVLLCMGQVHPEMGKSAVNVASCT